MKSVRSNDSRRARAADEELAHRRLDVARDRAERRAVDRDVAPAEHPLAVVHDRRLRGSPAGAGSVDGSRERKHFATA